MKKIIASFLVISAFIGYSFLNKFVTIDNTSDNTSITIPSINSSSKSSHVNSSVTYNDGTYTGERADAYWGYIQVEATISGGRITNVKFLEYPNDRGRSIEINQYADPILAQEAISAQSAQVDAVSGASDTSAAFIQSLSSALAKAQS